MIQSTMQANAKPSSSNSDNGAYKKSDSTTSLGRTRTITAIMIPLAFGTIGILLVIVILYRCRSKEPRRDTSNARESILLKEPNNTTAANTPVQDETRTCPPLSRDTHTCLRLSSDTHEYECPDDLKEEKKTSYTNTANDAPEYHVLEPIVNDVPDDRQMYQTLSRDQQPEYEAPNYSKHTSDSNIDPGIPEYHVLEPMDNNVPDVVYDVLEGPNPNDGPSGDQTHLAVDEQTTHNPLYQ
ncbi:uncharacterized protein LOC116290155 [Actinia tenebrosa]|uniref:Uncharacterized protein LOC116290155 n=1 Tax=Actinia tenebrosa TaxID=6105 RepID=A0A6P8HJZ3_ACTTE|nr:uncharacterized protein LOC116290155 [Actinia tenebrosa]